MNNTNLNLYNKVRSVPDEAKKPISAGRLKGMTDISPMWRIKVLTEQFGPCGFGWYFEVLDKWVEEVGDERVATVSINLYIKINDEWSKPIFGIGGSKLSTMEKNGLYVSDEAFKMATTDAISVSCKHLGVGADVYFGKDSTKYTNYSQDKPTDSNGMEVITTSDIANSLCSDKQVNFIKSLIAKRKENESDYLTKYPGKKSFAELTKSEAKVLIDYLNRGE